MSIPSFCLPCLEYSSLFGSEAASPIKKERDSYYIIHFVNSS
jgi:hypothetical protein